MKHLKTFEGYVQRAQQNKVKEILDSYLNAALDSDEWAQEHDGGDMLPFTEESISQAKIDIIKFLAEAKPFLGSYNNDQIGYDLWRCRSGHNTFWWSGENGKILTEIATKLGEVEAVENAEGLAEIIKESKTFENKVQKVQKYNVKDILDSYLNAALDSDEWVEEHDGGDMLPFSKESIEQAKKDITKFLAEAESFLGSYSSDKIGYDLWRCRSGHNSFWWSGEKGKILSEIAERLGQVEVVENKEGRATIKKA